MQSVGRLRLPLGIGSNMADLQVAAKVGESGIMGNWAQFTRVLRGRGLGL